MYELGKFFWYGILVYLGCYNLCYGVDILQLLMFWQQVKILEFYGLGGNEINVGFIVSLFFCVVLVLFLDIFDDVELFIVGVFVILLVFYLYFNFECVLLLLIFL